MLIIFLVLLCRPQSPDHAVHQLTAGMKFPTLLEAMVAAPMTELVSRRFSGKSLLTVSLSLPADLLAAPCVKRQLLPCKPLSNGSLPMVGRELTQTLTLLKLRFRDKVAGGAGSIRLESGEFKEWEQIPRYNQHLVRSRRLDRCTLAY
jgi:hypothetical protein